MPNSNDLTRKDIAWRKSTRSGVVHGFECFLAPESLCGPIARHDCTIESQGVDLDGSFPDTGVCRACRDIALAMPEGSNP